MKYRKLDADGDYVLGTGDDFHEDTPDAVAQAILTRLRLFRGDWFLDPFAGVPWKPAILGKSSAEEYDAVIRETIIGTQGVDSIESYSSDLEGRTLNIAATVETIYGRAEITWKT